MQHSAARRIADLPELATPVGIHGSSRQAELGGAVCYQIIVAVIEGGGGIRREDATGR